MATLVMDLDGTICSQMRSDEYHLALPLQATLTRMREFKKNPDNKIIIYTARGMNTYKGNVTEVIANIGPMTEDWLRKHQVPFDQLIFGKPPGDHYVDDKAMTLSQFRRSYDPEPL